MVYCTPYHNQRSVFLGELLRIGELSKQSGLTKRTIDYYTNLGLLKVSLTENNRYRQYSEDSLVRIQLINHYKMKHLTLDEIKLKLDVIHGIKEADIRKKIENIWSKLEEAETEVSELKTLMVDTERLKDTIEKVGHPRENSLQTILFLLERL